MHNGDVHYNGSALPSITYIYPIEYLYETL